MRPRGHLVRQLTSRVGPAARAARNDASPRSTSATGSVPHGTPVHVASVRPREGTRTACPAPFPRRRARRLDRRRRRVNDDSLEHDAGVVEDADEAATVAQSQADCRAGEQGVPREVHHLGCLPHGQVLLVSLVLADVGEPLRATSQGGPASHAISSARAPRPSDDGLRGSRARRRPPARAPVVAHEVFAHVGDLVTTAWTKYVHAHLRPSFQRRTAARTCHVSVILATDGVPSATKKTVS